MNINIVAPQVFQNLLCNQTTYRITVRFNVLYFYSIIFIFTYIPNKFYDSMGFNKYKNSYGDFDDEVDELVMYRS